MVLKSIEEEWAGFAEMIFANSPPAPNQKEEMKKAFFAGAWALFTALKEIGEPHISEAEGEAYLTDREAECIEFKERLMAEYAGRLTWKKNTVWRCARTFSGRGETDGERGCFRRITALFPMRHRLTRTSSGSEQYHIFRGLIA